MEGWFIAAIVIGTVAGLIASCPAYSTAKRVWHDMQKSNSAAPMSDPNSGMALVIAPAVVFTAIAGLAACVGFAITMAIGALAVYT